MKQYKIQKIYFFFLYFTLIVFLSCTKNQITQSTVTSSIPQLVSGLYSGNGRYMPSNQKIGSPTFSCIVPNWENLLKSGTATISISSLNDSMVHVVLSGGPYTTNFTGDFLLYKVGNVISDTKQSIKFFIDTKSIELSINNLQVAVANSCIPVNKYYYEFDGPITSPPSPNKNYFSIGTWEFNGSK